MAVDWAHRAVLELAWTPERLARVRRWLDDHGPADELERLAVAAGVLKGSPRRHRASDSGVRQALAGPRWTLGRPGSPDGSERPAVEDFLVSAAGGWARWRALCDRARTQRQLLADSERAWATAALSAIAPLTVELWPDERGALASCWYGGEREQIARAGAVMGARDMIQLLGLAGARHAGSPVQVTFSAAGVDVTEL